MKSLRIAALGLLAVAGALVPSGAWAASGARTSSFNYDASGLLIQEAVEPNTQALRLETDYGYDSFGNKTQVTVSGVDIATRSSTTTYDSQGQFAIQQTNALGQSEFWQYDARFGKPTYHRGPNGLVTTWQYDNFGRKTQEVRPDGTQTTWRYYQCAPNVCIAGVSYVVYEFLLDSQGNQNGPWSEVHFDMLDRELYHFTQGFDGRYATVQAIYDALGRVQYKSRPFFWRSNDPVQWTRFQYDTLGRLTVEFSPDHSTHQYDYHGLVTAVHDSYQRKRTVTKNSQGQAILVQEKDPYDTVLTSTSFTYDPFGNVLTATDNAGNVAVNAYDTRGRKTATNDPDLGNWTYTYNTISQLTGQTDAKGQHTAFTYDLLGRLIERDEPDMTSTWVYDTAQYGIGKLASASATGPAPLWNPQRSFTYDSLGRPASVGITIAGQTFGFAAAYDANSRLTYVGYPGAFATTYSYNSLGFLQQLSDASSGHPYWTANARDAELHLLQDTTGNNVSTVRTFDPATGRLTNIRAGIGGNNSVVATDYSYDLVGKLTDRTDYNNNITEHFTYDWLYRVASSQVKLISTQAVTASNAFVYDPIGNLTSKTGVGNYAYPPSGPSSVRPHAVTSISGGAINTTFSYDNNGNQTAGLGRSVTYTSYNKPASIQQGSTTIAFHDDADHQRFLQVAPETTLLYLDAFGVRAEAYLVPGVGWGWTSYLMVGGTMVGMRVQHPDSSITLRYFHQDHLGSIAVVTDQNGAVVERDSYDTWGKRRFLNGQDDPSSSLNTSSQTVRGFTGEEFLADVGLVHLNGRVYDPQIGRMMTADPVVGDAMNGQTWNRYSYVYNSPLTLTDPTGFCPSCGAVEQVGDFARHTFGWMRRTLNRNPIIGSLYVIASAAGCGPIGPLCAAVASAEVAGITTGNVGAAVRAGIVAGGEALAFQAIGTATLGPAHVQPDFMSPRYVANVIGHSLVGCGAAAASGNSCGAGALSAAVPAAAGPFLTEFNSGGRLAASTVLGGVASVAGGGKFANGAVTGAFGYLFNAAANCGVLDPRCQSLLESGAGGVAFRVSGPPVDVSPIGALAAFGLFIGTQAAGIRDWLNSDAASGAAGSAQSGAQVHANSANSIRGTDLYYLINLSSGAIDKIGITSNPGERYSQAYLAAENVRYETQARYTWRYAAMVDENIRLTFYLFENGNLPRLNKVTR